MTVLRRGAAHDSLAPAGPPPTFVSATQLREYLAAGDWDRAAPYLVPGGRAVLEKGQAGLPSLTRVERAVLARLRTMSADDWAALPDSGTSEGLPQRLTQAGRRCRTTGEFLELAKTRRYPHARLRRLLLWAFLGIAAAELPSAPPYLRVLGFNSRGQKILRLMKVRAALPVLTKPAHARALEGEAFSLFQLECRCTDLYDLCFDQVPTPGREWRTGPIIL
jgi:predicted nucleotidyltransferase